MESSIGTISQFPFLIIFTNINQPFRQLCHACSFCSVMSFTTGTVYLSPFGPTETRRALILCMFVYKHLEAIQRPSAIRAAAAAAATIGAPKRKNRHKEETCHHLAWILCQSLAIMSMYSIINYWREQVAYHSFFIPYAIINMGSIYLLQSYGL